MTNINLQKSLINQIGKFHKVLTPPRRNGASTLALGAAKAFGRGFVGFFLFGFFVLLLDPLEFFFSTK